MSEVWVNFFEVEFNVFVLKPLHVLLYLFIGLLCFPFTRFLGPKALRGEYHERLEQYSNDNAGIMNIIYRIIAPVVFSYCMLLGLFIVLNLIQVDWEFKIRWMPVLFYWIALIVNVSVKNAELYPLWTLLVQAFVSLCISIYFDWVVIDKFPDKGIESLDQSNIGWQFLTGTFLVISYIVLCGIVSAVNRYYSKVGKRAQSGVFDYAINAYDEMKLYEYVRKYDHLLPERYHSDVLLKVLFYTVLTLEDSNRPSWFRTIERLFFWTGRVKTTGIMQVKSDRILSDEDSILLGSELIERIWNQFIVDFARTNVDRINPVFMFSSSYYSYEYASLKQGVIAQSSKLYGKYCGTASYNICEVLRSTALFFENYHSYYPPRNVRVHSCLFQKSAELLPNRILCFIDGVLFVDPKTIPAYPYSIRASLPLEAGASSLLECVKFLDRYSFVVSIDYLTSLHYTITAKTEDVSFLSSIPDECSKWKFDYFSTAKA